MKKLLITLLLAAGCTAGYSQVTNTPPPILEDTNVVTTIGDVFDFFRHGSNFLWGVYGTADTTDHTFGGGIAIGYKATPNLVPTLRLDFLHGEVFVPSLNLSLELPISLSGTNVFLIPFTSAGAATSFNNDHAGQAIGIFGVGFALKFNKAPAWAPLYYLADYERWTGGGFNDDQFRLGVGYTFGPRGR